MKAHFRFPFARLSLVLVGSALFTGLAQAAIVFTDKTDFVNNQIAAGFYLENFESPLTPGSQGGASLGRTNGVFSYTISASSGLWVVQDGGAPALPSGQAIQPFFSGNNLVITFTSGNVTAFGGDFFLTDVGENWTNGTFTLGLSDGTTANVDLNTGPPALNTVAFRGFTNATPITSITFSNYSFPTTQFGTLDNFYVGTAVPEAPTWLGAGFIALVAAGRIIISGVNARKFRRSIDGSGSEMGN